MNADYDYKNLLKLSENRPLLYCEDNEGLHVKAKALLQRFITTVYAAKDGEEGLKLFRQHRPSVVVTDLRMPKLSGLDMMRQIREIEPLTKFIITSAYDEKEYLFQAINLHVFSYMKKPIAFETLFMTLMECYKLIQTEENSIVFNAYLVDLYNYAETMTVMLEGETPVFVNCFFLEFYNIKSLEEFNAKYKSFDDIFLEHRGFLYGNSWFKKSVETPDKLYHVKIWDAQQKNRHFIYKLHPIPNKENLYIATLNDVTDLNLLAIFDKDAAKTDKSLRNTTTIINLFDVIERNHSRIKLHNYYKGLTITNDGSIMKIDKEKLVITTNYLHQKAIQYEKKTIISSELLPSNIIGSKIEQISFEERSIIIKTKHLSFLESSPTDRKTTRLVPEENHKVTFFYDDRSFFGEVRIADISAKSVQLELNALPAGVEVNQRVKVDMVFQPTSKPLIINTDATVYKIHEGKKVFELVLILDLPPALHRNLVDYISKRQMALIREFKGLQYG